MREACIVLVVATLLSGVCAQTQVERFEQELEQTEGIERVDLFIRRSEAERTSDPALAVEYARRAHELARRLGDDRAQARALKNVGIGQYLLSDYPAAFESYRESLAIFEKLGDESAAADVVNNIGVLHYMWGDYDQALEYYTRVLESRRKLDDQKGVGSTLNNIGNLHHATGRYEKALEYLYDSLRIIEEFGDDQLVSRTLSNIGLALTQMDRHDEAKEPLERALAIAERADDRVAEALALNTLGMVYEGVGNRDLALGSYRRSLEIRREIGDRQGEAICLHNIGQALVSSGDPAPALPYLHEALRTSEAIEVREIQRDVWETLSETYEGMGDPQQALAAYKRYKELDAELFSREASRRLSELQTRYDVEKKDREIEILRANEKIQRTARNVSLGATILLVLLIALVYRQYRLGVRANREMRKANEAMQLAQAERERAMRAELTHITRVATLGELAAALAHELNQPLTAIRSNAQATRRMLAGGQDPAMIDEALGDIVEGSGRAREIIQRLRALIRRGDEEFKDLDFNRAIREIATIARVDTERHRIDLVLDLPDGLPRIVGDRIQLQQVVLNLVHNAVEAIADGNGEGGEIVVETRGDGGGIRTEVRDTGPGLDDDTLDAMFNPFFTTKSDGLGMGLTICASIIDAHGGKIAAERNPDRGLAVCFVLPTIPQDPTA